MRWSLFYCFLVFWLAGSPCILSSEEPDLIQVPRATLERILASVEQAREDMETMKSAYEQAVEVLKMDLKALETRNESLETSLTLLRKKTVWISLGVGVGAGAVFLLTGYILGAARK